MKQLAQGIASLGRGEDKMLVHMTPGEVQGLQQLALSHGGSLTVNPHTGLVEAGFLSDILGFAAPILGGMAFGPIGAGLASGLTSYAKEGDVGKALGAGALSFGGASLLGGLKGVGSDMMGAANTEGVQALMPPEEIAKNMATNQGPFDMGLGSEAVPSYGDFTNQTLPPQTPEQIAGLTKQAMPYANESFGQQASDVFAKNDKSYMDKVGAGFKQVTSSGQNAMDFLSKNKLPLAATGLGLASLMTPDQAAPAAPKLQGTRQDFTYNQPKYDANGRLISAPSYTQMGSTPYYAAAGGEIKGMAKGGTPVGPYGGSTAGPYDHPVKSEKQEMGELARLIALYSRGQGDPEAATRMAAGGIASLPNEYAAGGKLLQGPGDGMSDSIPAVIKGPRPQRAALAQGEFVIPADVVSHLGNGSTDAGSKRLYAMMDKIRHARTGTKKQGRQINPANFMPA